MIQITKVGLSFGNAVFFVINPAFLFPTVLGNNEKTKTENVIITFDRKRLSNQLINASKHIKIKIFQMKNSHVLLHVSSRNANCKVGSRVKAS